jgi:hypothetical protein
MFLSLLPQLERPFDSQPTNEEVASSTPQQPPASFPAAQVGGANDARAQLFSQYAEGPRRGPKKTATKEEAAEIQGLIDRAHEADREAVALEKEAQEMAERHDKGAHQKALDADAKRRSARGMKQEAIAHAVSAYGIDITHVKSLLYDRSNSDGDSETDGRTVTIGDAAFTSPGNLGSTIAHESEVHVNRQTMKGRVYEGPEGNALNEVEAYDYEIAGAARFGLTKEDIAGLRRNRAHYMAHLGHDALDRRAKGDYTMPKGHEED